MAFLNSGVLIKLLEDINTDETAAASSDDRKPSLLQIRSIVPVLSDGNLWPNQGFYLKVSDASHAMHVSLPKEKDEFVLCNKLNIGQFVYVDRLEPAYPVPLLVGVRPFPGRNSCVSARKDLVSMENLVEISGTSDPETVEEVIKDMEEKSSRKVRTTSRMVRNMALECFRDRSDPSDSDGSRRVDRDSDTESTISTCSAMSRMMKRRSWNDSDNSRLDDTMETPTVTRRLKPIRHSTSTNGRIVQQRKDGSLEAPISKATRKGASVLSPKATRSMKGGNKVSVASLKKSSREVSMDDTANSSSLNEGWRMEDTILWASLPSSLLMLGKEVLKQRDAAVLASVEALQEAAGAERLLKCLSAYSEIQAASSEDHETEALVDQFFRLQDDLSQSRLIVKSLAGNTQVNLSETPQKEPNEDALKLSCERKERAQLWIRTALASDLAMPTSLEKIVGHDNTPKGRSILQKLSKPKHNCGSSDHNKLEWSRGSLLCATSDLEISLQRESRALFLGYLDEYVDDIKWRFSRERRDNIVGTMLQIRRVSNWIDLMAKKESSSCPDLEDPEFSTYGRIKNKIYRILLMHIDKTAMVWENMGAVLP